MALSITSKITHFFTVKKLTWILAIIAILSAVGSIYTYKRMQQIDAFNLAVTAGKPPETDRQSFEARFATALYLAKKERYKESILLFTALMPKAADNNQRSAVQYNIGNISFLRGLAINGTNMTVKAEAEYLVPPRGRGAAASRAAASLHRDLRHRPREKPTPGLPRVPRSAPSNPPAQ